MKRILICGGRDYGRLDASNFTLHPKRRAERRRLEATLFDLLAVHGQFILIHGGAKGADALAAGWAADNLKEPAIEFRAEWENIYRTGAVVKYRKSDGKPFDAAAGPSRNQRMIEEGKPCLCIAFPGGKGTQDMVDRAKAAGIEVKEIL